MLSSTANRLSPSSISFYYPRRMLSSVFNYVFSRQQHHAQEGFTNKSNNNAINNISVNAIRHYATNNPAISPECTSTFHPRLQTIFQQLDAIAPRFVLSKGDITILNQPDQFYNHLKLKVSQANSRIFLSSLYIGKAQHELIECLDQALTAKQDLKVYILTDALRGTREAPHNPCSASLLVPLVEKFGKHRVDVRMYHTPHLSGFKKNWTPKRINESWGLQHMKLYGFDDEIVLSGANLSEDYFTDRQDRYYVFNHRELTNYYYRIHHAVSSLSYQLLPSQKQKSGFRLSWPTSNKSCEPDLNVQRFISDSSFLLEPLLKQHQLENFEQFDDTNEFDTIVYPVSQFTPLMQPSNDISTEKPAVLRLLSYLDSPRIKWWFTAGYFNMLPEIQERLLNGHAEGTVITASAQANSFYKSSGMSYYIPEAYLLIAKKFLEEVTRRGKEQLITLYEWKNGVVNTLGGWSYHAKGLWITVPEENEPSITVIGSSNYTKRAYSLDLESNAVIITKDSELKQQMKAEIENLMKHVKPLQLSDFEPKLQASQSLHKSGLANLKTPQVAATAASITSDGNGNETRDEQPAPNDVYAVDEERRISYIVHLALKLFGGKL